MVARSKRPIALALALIGVAIISAAMPQAKGHAQSFTSSALSDELQEGIAAYDREDYLGALRLLRPLAERGQARAELYLGLMYLDGLGVAADAGTAVKWFRAAAEQGDLESEYNLGLAFYQGNGVPQNYREAAQWFGAATKQGYGPAAYNLATMYEDGLGVARDPAQALGWYTAAAEAHLPEAMHELGAIYSTGRLGPRDPVTAYAWLMLATQNGDDDAVSDAADAEQALSPEQREEAKRRALTLSDH
jgi:TPR repeat protein